MFSRFGHEGPSTQTTPKVTRRRSLLGPPPSANSSESSTVSSTVASVASPMKNRKQFWPKRRNSMFGNSKPADDGGDSPLKTSLWSPVRTKNTLSLKKDASPIEGPERKQRRFFRRSSLGHVPQSERAISTAQPSLQNLTSAKTSSRRNLTRTASESSSSNAQRSKPPARTSSGQSSARRGTSPLRRVARTLSREAASKSPRKAPPRNLSTPNLKPGPARSDTSTRPSAPRPASTRNLSPNMPPGRSLESMKSLSSVKSKVPGSVSSQSARSLAPKSPKRRPAKSPRSPTRDVPLSPKPDNTPMRSKPGTPMRKMKPLPPQESPDGSPVETLQSPKSPVANAAVGLNAPSLSPTTSSKRQSPASGFRRATMSHVSPQKASSLNVAVGPTELNVPLSPATSVKPPQKWIKSPEGGYRRATMSHVSSQVASSNASSNVALPLASPLLPVTTATTTSTMPPHRPDKTPGRGFRRATMSHMSPQVVSPSPAAPKVSPVPPVASAKLVQQQTPARTPVGGFRRATMSHTSPQVTSSDVALPVASSLSPIATVRPPHQQRQARTPGGGFRRTTMSHISPQVAPSDEMASDVSSEAKLGTPIPISENVAISIGLSGGSSITNKPALHSSEQQNPVNSPVRRFRRASLSHVPFADGDDTKSGCPMSPQRRIAAQIGSPGPKSPVRTQKMPFQLSGVAACPMTPAVDHSPMKRPGKGKIAIAPSDGLCLETEDTEVEEVVSRNTRLYEYAKQYEWESVAEECRLFPRDAKCVDEVDGTTALHLAVISRSNPSLRDGDCGTMQPAPIHLIEQLVVACPEAAITRCLKKKYTPLTYACVVLDHDYDMEESSKVVSILLHHAPQSVYVFTDDGFSALDIHILSYSRFHKGMEEVECQERPSTIVLQTLLEEKPDLAEARSYRNRVRGPVELLYRSNLEEFKSIGKDFSATQSNWWAWKWVSLLLKYAPNTSGELPERNAPFSALHAAAGLVGCPLPVLSLAATTFPSQLSEPDPRGALGNLPLHEVCSWVCDQETINGDPFVVRRKAMAIHCLLVLCPEAARAKNKMEETPLQLAIESRTPWEVGLKPLVDTYPGALEVPRKLRDGDDDNDLLLSTEVYDDNESVGSDWVDPLEAVEGMYPFLVAAVVAHIPDNKLKGPTYFSEASPEEYALDLVKKELESIRSIFGLLRRKPDLLSKFKPVIKVHPVREPDASYTDYSDYTEVTIED